MRVALLLLGALLQQGCAFRSAPVRGVSRSRLGSVQAVVAQEKERGRAALSSLPPGTVLLWDTTLRDGTQAEGINPTVSDKERICQRLLQFGVGVVEAGFPTANEKDAELFERLRAQSGFDQVAAFCMSRRKGVACSEDPSLTRLVDMGVARAAMVVKASEWQVTKILGVAAEEGISMCGESVDFLAQSGVEVAVDLEHCVDGYKANAAYTTRVAMEAARKGAACLVICDTNGGSMPWEIEEVVRGLQAALDDEGLSETLIGIHCHNDCGMAVANSVAAVQAGARVVHGCINGIGERTGNANLCTVAAIAALKLDMPCLGDIGGLNMDDTKSRLRGMTAVSKFVDEIFNMPSNEFQPFVGNAAFAHKGGLHVSALARDADSYQHIDPNAVGNAMRVLVSDLSGKATIKKKLEDWALLSSMTDEAVQETVRGVKSLESLGFSFEGCDASVEMMARRQVFKSPFRIFDYNVFIAESDFQRNHPASPQGPYSNLVSDYWSAARATVKLELPALESRPRQAPSEAATADEARGLSWGSEVQLHCAEGNGPVNALARALIQVGLGRASPGLGARFAVVNDVELTDYKVRILDGVSATGAVTRVTATFRRYLHVTEQFVEWSTVGADPNIVTASLAALVDGFEYAIVKEEEMWKKEVRMLGM
eukprot:scaffold1411_cov252-Pinguiococcus_pyrenoidosus.AAC.12